MQGKKVLVSVLALGLILVASPVKSTPTITINDTVEGSISATATGGFYPDGSTPVPPPLIIQESPSTGTAGYVFWEFFSVSTNPPLVAQQVRYNLYEPGTNLSDPPLSSMSDYLQITIAPNTRYAGPTTETGSVVFYSDYEGQVWLYYYTPVVETGLLQSFSLGDFTVYVASGDAVPEPTTMLLLGSGLIGLAGLWRKFKKL